MTQKIKDLVEIKTGKLNSNASVENGRYPFFTCDPTTLAIDNYNFDEEAVLLAGNNASGNFSAKYYKGKFDAYQRTYVITSKDTNTLDVKFLCYAVNMQLDGLKQRSSGSTTKFLTLGMLHQLEIPAFSIKEQKRIASILSAYDDLIENNKKQIKLLEEAAQRLYKEWFVDLRFPGYENVPIVDGMPEGWKKITLSDIECRLESGGRPKGGIDSSLKNGIPSVGAENVIGLGQYKYSSEKLIPFEYFKNMKKGVIRDRDILIYKDGAYIGRTSLFQDGFPHIRATVNEHVFLLHANNEIQQYYLFFTLYQTEYYHKMQKLNKNAAQPGINIKAILSLDCVLPTDDLLNKFDIFVTPIMHNIFALAKQNRNLEKARDRLLPKLMSGEIEV